MPITILKIATLSDIPLIAIFIFPDILFSTTGLEIRITKTGGELKGIDMLMVGMIIDSYDRTFDDIMQFYSVYRFIDLVQLVIDAIVYLFMTWFCLFQQCITTASVTDGFVTDIL
eukprot:CAMPEP_0170991706 /NCGR_PEP_ID=MMETSP0736-20130129/9276_1 /TAXON_ID=186038 /ORGANISM="Fragilariopsis kerguelensis, Strain L26-C5" /LENGTH=114 /DNA_ID=CAMNT_0011416961 /DNA_START=401 /DNA_END=745 /DNA_ORIENTATION=-